MSKYVEPTLKNNIRKCFLFIYFGFDNISGCYGTTLVHKQFLHYIKSSQFRGNKLDRFIFEIMIYQWEDMHTIQTELHLVPFYI